MSSLTTKYFAQLCEGVLFEVSSSINLVRQLKGGPELVKYLHKQEQLSHDQEYQTVPKISWSVIKDSPHWVILQYRNGTGAIKAERGTYQALASTGEGDPETFNNDRGGNILDFLKQRLGGNPTAIYVGRDSREVRIKKSSRQNRKQDPDKPRIDQRALLLRFKPMWQRAITAAVADVKGMVGQMIKNDSFDKASNKIKHLQTLTNMLDQFETNPDSVLGSLDKTINKAVLMAAAHHYPDETGEIRKSWGGIEPASYDGVNKLLADISSGDTKKMGTVLSFFKRSLIA